MMLQYNEAREIERAYEWLRDYYKKPIHPEYHQAATVEEALSILEKYGDEAKIFAGGIDVMGLIKARVNPPGILVNIKPIRKMQHMTMNAAGLSIGALNLVRDLERPRRRLLLVDDGHVELLSLGVLRPAGGISCDQVVRLPADTAGDLAAVPFDQLSRCITRH